MEDNIKEKPFIDFTQEDPQLPVEERILRLECFKLAMERQPRASADKLFLGARLLYNSLNTKDWGLDSIKEESLSKF